jgi:hypothetical protein
MSEAMKKAALAWLALALLAGSTRASSPVPPYSYKKPSPDGRFVFVMLSPLPPEADAESWIKHVAEEIREIRRTYPASGLYRNDSSVQPLWTVTGYWTEDGVEVASDGVHLVRLNRLASKGADTVIAGLANGQEVWSYRLKDLVPFPQLLPRSWPHSTWLEAGDFDDNALTYSVTTKQGDRWVFDVRTGEPVRSFRLFRWAALLILVVFVAAALAAWVFWPRRKTPNPSMPPAGKGAVGEWGTVGRP